MRLHVVAPLLALIYASTASADLVRVDFTGHVTVASNRPIGQVIHGSLVYDSNAIPTGKLSPATDWPRFDGAITQFEMEGIDGGWAANYVYVVDATGPDGEDSVGFRSQSGLSITFYGTSDVLDGAFLPAVFPQNWTYAAWDILPPAEADSYGQTSAVSSTIIGPSPTVSAERRVLLAANEGIDTAACGGEGNKCRSIGQAIRNARPGDTVLVEAGVYGDLNGNGVLGEAGEEADRTGCECVVHVDKAITVLSERGAAATIIDARNVQATSLAPQAVVFLGVNTSFGYTGQGFTVLAASTRTGIRIARGLFSGVRIWGNRVSGANEGIQGQSADVYDNEITANGTGINLSLGRVVDNVIARNTRSGIALQGFLGEDLEAVIADNVIIGNGEAGIEVAPDSRFATSVTGNDIVGNAGPGIRWRLRGSSTPNAVVQDNNIFGNGQGCGTLNDTVGLVWATDNYWGGLGVADRACNGPNATTVVDPVRTEPDGRFGP